MLKLFGFFHQAVDKDGKQINGELLTQEFGYDADGARRRIYSNLLNVPGIYYPRAPFEMRAYVSSAKAVEFPLHDPDVVEARLRLAGCHF